MELLAILQAKNAALFNAITLESVSNVLQQCNKDSTPEAIVTALAGGWKMAAKK